MRKIPGIVLAVVVVGLTACSGGGGKSVAPSPASSASPARPANATTSSAVQRSPSSATLATSAPPLDCGARYLAQFTTRQKLAQLLTVGVTGYADAENVVRTEQVGGIFIGSWTDQALLADNQINQVKTASRIPVMVTIDEEGGRVSRLENLIGSAPSARSAANNLTVDQFYTQSLARTQAMRKLGITVDFAPDVDVSDEPDDAAIGDRSYSDKPEVVTSYAGTLIRALHDGGVGAVLKHFPGHGHGSGDTHTGTVQTPPLEQLQQVDLVPFRELIGSGAAVMVGHLDVPGLTTPNVPASISPQAMALLRQGTGYNAAPFDGPIFTDDLGGMAAITNRMDIEDAVTAALEAGADDALWTTTTAVPKVLDRLEQEVRSGKLPMDQVDRSVLRLARYKGVPLQC
jgi:beta-N-acetylhexosaminidase